MGMEALVRNVFDTIGVDAEEDAITELAAIGSEFAHDVLADAKQIAEEDGRDTVTADDILDAARH